MLDAYRAAYAARDIKAPQAVQVLPPALQKSVASEFTNPRYQMVIEKVSINVASGARTAVVHAGVTRSVVDLNGRWRTQRTSRSSSSKTREDGG